MLVMVSGSRRPWFAVFKPPLPPPAPPPTYSSMSPEEGSVSTLAFARNGWPHPTVSRERVSGDGTLLTATSQLTTLNHKAGGAIFGGQRLLINSPVVNMLKAKLCVSEWLREGACRAGSPKTDAGRHVGGPILRQRAVKTCGHNVPGGGVGGGGWRGMITVAGRRRRSYGFVVGPELL